MYRVGESDQRQESPRTQTRSEKLLVLLRRERGRLDLGLEEGIRNHRLVEEHYCPLSQACTIQALEAEISFYWGRAGRSGVPDGISNDAATSMENDTVEVFPDSSVTTRLDESLISALKRVLPPEPVKTTGKLRDVVGRSTREPGRQPSEESFGFGWGYEGMEVTVCMEWKISVGALKFTSQVSLGLDAYTRGREPRS